MDTDTIDQEYGKLEGEFEDVVKTVQALADKMQAAEKAGDANATEWIADLKLIVQDISDEQTQAKVLLLAIHAFIKNAASEAPEQKPPLLAPGTQIEEPQQQQPVYQRGGMFGGGMMGGGMMGGGMMGGYMGGGFARAMEMGAGMSLGSSLISSIFR
jgi:hypothetical protein